MTICDPSVPDIAMDISERKKSIGSGFYFRKLGKCLYHALVIVNLQVSKTS